MPFSSEKSGDVKPACVPYGKLGEVCSTDKEIIIIIIKRNQFLNFSGKCFSMANLSVTSGLPSVIV